MYMSGLDPSTIHFFDKSSVVKTRHQTEFMDIARKGLVQSK